MSPTSLYLTIFSALTLSSGAAPEHPPANNPKTPARHARILPVGDSPPFIQEVRDGVRVEIDPPAGELPPRALVTRVRPEEHDKNHPLSPTNVPLSLNRISPPLDVPHGNGILAFDLHGAKPAPSPWLQVTRPESGDFMILLCRDPKEKSWNKAASLIIPDGPAGTPAGTVRVTSLFPANIHILWGGEKLLVKPGSSFTRPIKPETDVAFEVLSVDTEGTAKRYYSNQISQNPGERGFITIYRADGESPRRPLKVLVFREPAPTPAIQ